MWMCEEDGAVIADQQRHTAYTGHQRFKPLRPPAGATSAPQEPVERDDERLPAAERSTAPDWYREERAQELERFANPPEWPPTPEKAKQGRAE